MNEEKELSQSNEEQSTPAKRVGSNKGKTYQTRKKKRLTKPGEMQGNRRQVLIDEATLHRINEKNKLTDKERFALFAYIVSPEPDARKRELAYVMSRKVPTTASGDSLYTIAWRWFKSEPVTFFIEDTEEELFRIYQKRVNREAQLDNVISGNTNSINDNTDNEQSNNRNNVANDNDKTILVGTGGYEFMTKDDMIRELEALIAVTQDVKLKAEIVMKLADLTQAKKEQARQEEEQVRYYLPLKCSQCNLYQTAKRS